MVRPTFIEGPAWPGVHSIFTTRSGGVSRPPYHSLNLGLHVGDAPEAVDENRRRLNRMLPESPLWLQQVHGVDVLQADIGAGALNGPDDVAPVADAAVTQRRGQVLAIMVADCLPVMLSNSAGTVLGVAHAGWRGLAAGVLEQTLGVMQRRTFETDAWCAWVGPSIGPDAFEVGAEVHDAYVSDDPLAAQCFRKRDDRAHKWWCDLPALAERRLRRMDVQNVVLARQCTVSEPDSFFSYRRDGRTGRMALLAWLD